MVVVGCISTFDADTARMTTGFDSVFAPPETGLVKHLSATNVLREE